MSTITDISQLDFDKKYTYKDYLTWKFKERVELIKGYLFRMSPAPTSEHQMISNKISTPITIFLSDTKCKLFYAPFDVRFYDQNDPTKAITNVVQPDISVICDPEKIDRRGCLGAPDLIVEILSPSTSEKDLTWKYDLYEESGVKEYWVVNPTEKNMMIYTLDHEGKYQPSRLFTRGDVISSLVLKGFSLNLSDVFEPFDWEAHEAIERTYNRV